MLQPRLGQGPYGRGFAIYQLFGSPSCLVPVLALASELFLGPQGCFSCTGLPFQRQIGHSLRRGWRSGSGPGLLAQPLAGGFLFFCFELLLIFVSSGGSAYF